MRILTLEGLISIPSPQLHELDPQGNYGEIPGHVCSQESNQNITTRPSSGSRPILDAFSLAAELKSDLLRVRILEGCTCALPMT